MAKKKSKKTAPEMPAEANQTPVKPTGSMTKADAVRAALQAGVEKPQDASAWIKEKFGIEIAPQVFSSYKSSLGKKSEGSSGNGVATKAGSISLEAAEQVKDLVRQHGVDTVKKLAEFFR